MTIESTGEFVDLPGRLGLQLWSVDGSGAVQDDPGKQLRALQCELLHDEPAVRVPKDVNRALAKMLDDRLDAALVEVEGVPGRGVRPPSRATGAHRVQVHRRNVAFDGRHAQVVRANSRTSGV